MTHAPGTDSPLAAPTPSSSPTRVLRNRNFLRLWIGSVTSAGGTAIGSIILIWLVYSSTHSPLAISVLGIVQFLPTLAFGLIAGALIDRLDRRRLMLACDVARAICFGSLAVFVLLFGVSTTVLIAVVFVVATFSTVFRPATNAAIPRILDRADLADGNGILQGGSTIAQFVGSPIGGVLILTTGATLGLALNAVTFAISASMIFLMVIPPPMTQPASAALPAEPPRRGSLLGEVRDGLRFVRSQTALLIITLTAMAANFFLTMWGGFMVFYAGSQLHQGAGGFSILVAAVTAGFAIGSILPGRLHLDRAPGLALIPTWGISGALLVGIALTHSLPVAIALTIATGATLSMGNTTWLSGVQRTVPDEYLGRYFATDEAGSFAMVPAGLAVGGALVFTLGIGGAYLVAGLGALVANVPLFVSAKVRAWGRTTRA